MICAGRRSLLIHFPDERCQDLCIASVSCPSAGMQLPEACPGLATAAEDGGSSAPAEGASHFWEVRRPATHESVSHRLKGSKFPSSLPRFIN